MRIGFHPLSRIPQPWRKVLDWLFTITLAIVFVLVFEAKVAKPIRIPSSSMEPYLHCAKPGTGCLGSTDDRVLAFQLEYDFESPQRGQIVVFKAPATASRLRRRRRGNHLRQTADRAVRRNCARGQSRIHLDPQARLDGMGKAE
jgi:hypothetical protein